MRGAGRLADWMRREPLLAVLTTLSLVFGLAAVATVGVLVTSVASAPDRTTRSVASEAAVPEGPTLPESEEPQEVGTVRGTVTDPDGQPVSGVDVVVRTEPFEPYATGPGKPMMPPGPVWEATTDEDGTYELDEVTPGSHRVRFAQGGPRRFVEQHNGGAPTLHLAADVEVHADETTEVDAQLELGGQVVGTVRPVPGRRLASGTTAHAELRVDGSWVTVAEAEVGPAGRYRLDRLPPGTYRLRVQDQHSGAVLHPAAVRPADAATFEVAEGGTVQGVDVVVPKPGRLVGRVLRVDGTPIAGAVVNLYSGMVSTPHGAALVQGHQQAHTDSSGRYEFRAPTGSYGLWVGRSTWPDACGSPLPVLHGVVVRAGEEARRDVRQQRTSTVSGTITDDRGRPLAGVKVEAERVQDAVGCPVDSRTDDRGRYRLTGVRPGLYTVRATSRRHLGTWFPGTDDPKEARRVRARPGSHHAGVDSVMVEGGQITGRVDVRGRRGVVRIDVTAVETGSTDGSQAEGSAQVRRDGRYRIVGLRAGTYRLHFSPWPTGSMDQTQLVLLTSDGTSRDEAEAVDVEVSLARTRRLPDTLLDLSGRISGRVTDPRGRPRSGIQVAAHQRDETGEWVEVASTWTDASGRYALRNLGGTYRIGFAGAHEFFPDVRDVDDAEDLPVEPGEAVGDVDAELAFEWD